MSDIEPTYIYAGLTAISGFIAWLIRYLLNELKAVIDRNTDAVNNIRLTMERCKFVQEFREAK